MSAPQKVQGGKKMSNAPAVSSTPENTATTAPTRWLQRTVSCPWCRSASRFRSPGRQGPETCAGSTRKQFELSPLLMTPSCSYFPTESSISLNRIRARGQDCARLWNHRPVNVADPIPNDSWCLVTRARPHPALAARSVGRGIQPASQAGAALVQLRRRQSLGLGLRALAPALPHSQARRRSRPGLAPQHRPLRREDFF